MSTASEQILDNGIQECEALTETLNQLSTIHRYNRWIYDEISAGLGKRILEVGSGTGNITQFLLAEKHEVLATDVLPNYREELKNRFGNNPLLQISTFDLDRTAPSDFKAAPFDSVVCLNVLEHIENDIFALQQMRDVIKPGGHLALLVPAHQFLFGEFDTAVGHFRRYNKKSLRTQLEKAGFKIKSLKYFNAAATLPWFINGRLLRRAYLPNEQVSLADKLVPILKLEKFIGPPLGISLIAIAQK